MSMYCTKCQHLLYLLDLVVEQVDLTVDDGEAAAGQSSWSEPPKELQIVAFCLSA